MCCEVYNNNNNNNNNLSSLLSTKPWYESEVETLTEEEIKECLLHLIVPFCQYDTVNDCHNFVNCY